MLIVSATSLEDAPDPEGERDGSAGLQSWTRQIREMVTQVHARIRGAGFLPCDRAGQRAEKDAGPRT